MLRHCVVAAALSIFFVASIGHPPEAEACGVKFVVKANKRPRRQVGTRVAAKTKRTTVAARTGRETVGSSERAPIAAGPDERPVVARTEEPKRVRVARAASGRAPTVRRQPTAEPAETPAAVAATQPEPKRVEPKPEPKRVEPKPEPKRVAVAQPKREPKRAVEEVPDTKPEPVAKAPGAGVLGRRVHFGSGSDRVANRGHLSRVAAYLKANPGVSLRVVGYADSVGDESVNQALSERRAQAVVSQLVALGVDESRLSATGEGEANPIASNATAKGRSLNRRVELVTE